MSSIRLDEFDKLKMPVKGQRAEAAIRSAGFLLPSEILHYWPGELHQQASTVSAIQEDMYSLHNEWDSLIRYSKDKTGIFRITLPVVRDFIETYKRLRNAKFKINPAI